MFDEILFADDTICITRDTRTMNKMLSAVEKIGWKSGMRLNKGKCEALQFGGKSKIVFHNKTPVKSVEKSKYLGCVLNKSNNVIIEVRGRIREAMGILKRLHRFMRHSNCKLRFKLTVIQAVLFSKILFGLESAELPNTALKALDVFHLKCLRKILKLNTTFVNRNNTNVEVLRKANQHLPANKQIKLLSQVYLDRKQAFFAKVTLAPLQDPVRTISFL